MILVFKIVFSLLIFMIGFVGTLATIAGVGSSLGIDAQAMSDNVNVFIVISLLVSGFLTWGFYEQELK